jgi:hypothetical protein
MTISRLSVIARQAAHIPAGCRAYSLSEELAPQAVEAGLSICSCKGTDYQTAWVSLSTRPNRTSGPCASNLPWFLLTAMNGPPAKELENEQQAFSGNIGYASLE